MASASVSPIRRRPDCEMEDYESPPPLPKKKGGTLSTNADQEFLKMIRDKSFHPPKRGSTSECNVRRSKQESSSKRSPDEVSEGHLRRVPPVPSFEDEDEVTNFLIEENMRRNRRYFGASLLNNGSRGMVFPRGNQFLPPVTSRGMCTGTNTRASPGPFPPIVSSQRNPIVEEIIRGELKNSSKRSLQEFTNNKRQSTRYSSDRQIICPPKNFSDDRKEIFHNDEGGNFSFRQKLPNDKNDTSSNSQVDNHNRSQRRGNPKSLCSPYLQSEMLWIESLGHHRSPRSVQEVIKAIEDENIPKQKRRLQNEIINKEELKLPIKNKNSSTVGTENIENGNKRRTLLKGIQDHPERDSLDGNLPGSSHGTSTGNPPPPPTPPGSNNNDGDQIDNNNSNPNNDDETVNNNPDGEPPSGGNYSKGPNAKSKKHKRLKNETSTLDFPSKDKDQKKRPSYDSSKSRDVETGGFRTKTEPYTYLWVVLSQMYGKLIILLMLAFCLTEVLDNQIAPLTFQEVFLLYLYIGSIVAIMCIYVTVIVDNCPSITGSKENLTKAGDDPEVGSITSFGTLKRAHISRSKTSRTSFYLRIGALVFGLGTLIYNGLEIAMHSSIPEGCISDTILAHPIMQALFTFLQMHFLFVNSEVIVEKFGQIARFGFMHLVATNLALWVRMVVWESANDSMITIKEQGGFDEGGPIALGFHSLELQRLTKCYQNNTLGQLWSDSQQYLFPFIVQYSLIAASVTYVMWCNVGKERLRKLCSKAMSESSTIEKRKGHWKVDCRSSSKGLFLGLLVLVGGVVILIIFFVMKDQIDFRENLFWMRNGTMMIIFSLSIMATIFGFIQIPKLSVSTTQPMDLDRLLLSITIVGVYIFSIFGMIVGGIDYNNSEKLASFCTNTLLLVQVSLQGMLVAEASRRTCANRYQMSTKPGRQVITFLLFSNVTLWILDTFMTHNSITHQFQIEFYGKVVWGVISRIALPLMILFRFHSAVILVEIWKNTYRTKTD